jgi:hypothetical protein
MEWVKQHPNSAEGLKEAQARLDKATGVFYRQMIDHVRKVLADIKRVVPEYDPQQGYELVGFVWFQGFNDMIDEWNYDQNRPGGYDLHSRLLADLIRDVRKDLSAPKMPFMIGVMGIGGLNEDKKPGSQKYFRQAQAALQARSEKKEKLTPEEEKRLKAGVSNGGYHYLGAAKIMAPIGKAFAEALVNMQKPQEREKQ